MLLGANSGLGEPCGQVIVIVNRDSWHDITSLTTQLSYTSLGPKSKNIRTSNYFIMIIIFTLQAKMFAPAALRYFPIYVLCKIWYWNLNPQAQIFCTDFSLSSMIGFRRLETEHPIIRRQCAKEYITYPRNIQYLCIQILIMLAAAPANLRTCNNMGS